MGGNVFPGKNRRYSKEEYFQLIDELSLTFDAISRKFNICPSLKDKESYGDMDVVLIPYIPFSIDALKSYFNTEYVSKNGTTYSLLYKEFQIDLILADHAEYEFTKNYMGFGDRCNFIGKLAHQLGLKFGHDGLWLPVRTSDSHKIGDVLLTLAPRKAEDFLDVKPLENTDTFKDVFDNVCASKYFNPEIFKLENNNTISRVRDKKRPYYHQFLDLCRQLPNRDYFIKSSNKTEYISLIFEAFPDACKEYNDMIAKKEAADIYKSKVNGDIVSSLTGLTGKPLGDFMIKIKKELSVEVCEKMSADEVKDFILVLVNS